MWLAIIPLPFLGLGLCGFVYSIVAYVLYDPNKTSFPIWPAHIILALSLLVIAISLTAFLLLFKRARKKQKEKALSPTKQ